MLGLASCYGMHEPPPEPSSRWTHRVRPRFLRARGTAACARPWMARYARAAVVREAKAVTEAWGARPAPAAQLAADRVNASNRMRAVLVAADATETG